MLLPNLEKIAPVEDLFDESHSSVYDAVKGNRHKWNPALSFIQKHTLFQNPYSDPGSSTSSDAARPIASMLIALGTARSRLKSSTYCPVPWVFWQSLGPLSFHPAVSSYMDLAFHNLQNLALVLTAKDMGQNTSRGPTPL